MADGRITIDTKIDTSGIITGFGDIIKACVRMAGKTEGLRDSVKASFAQQAESIQKTVKAHKEQEKSAEKAIRKQEELGEKKIPTEEYRKLGEAIEETKKKIKEVEDQQKEWMNLGFSMDSEAFDTTDAALVKLNRDMEELLQHQAEMREKGTDFVGGGIAAPEASGNGNLSETEDAVAEAAKEVGGYVTVLQASLNGLKTVVTRAIPLLVESALSGLMSSLAQCKNALATVFDPILQAIAPALNYMISLVTAAATAVVQLIAALTGKSTFVKAVKVQKDYAKSLKGTGGAAKEAGEEAEGSLASFDKLNVMAEEAAGSGGGGGGGGAGIGDMFETVEVEPVSFDSWGQAFDSFLNYLLNNGIPALRNALSQLADWINTLASNLYEMFTFPGVREKVQLLGRELAEAFNDFTSQIDWAMVGKALGAGFDLAIQFFVNFIWTYDWMALGKSLAEMINNAIEQVDWYDFGRLLWAKFKISLETLAGFLLNLDMKEIAAAASNIVKGFLDSISETLKKIDWQGIGNQIATFIRNIDYGGIFTSITYGIGVALASLAEFIWGLIEEAWNDVVEWWKENAYEDGEFTMQRLLDGIVNKLKDIGAWIKEHIFDPFIKGFKSAFGIHSPSTKMKEMGGLLMEGLKEGISNLIPSVIEKFGELKEKIGAKWDEIKEYASSKWEDIKTNLSDIWDSMKETAGTKFSDIKEKISEMWGEVKNNSDSKWGEIKTSLFDIWDDLKLKAEEKFKDIKDAVTGAWDKIKDFGRSVGGMVTGGYLDTASVLSLRAMTPPAEPIHLPRLASGTVVPPRAGEFAAILGDNRRETEVVSPLSTMKQAMIEALAQAGGTGGGDITAHIYLDGRELGRSTVKFVREEKKRTGINPVMV